MSRGLQIAHGRHNGRNRRCELTPDERFSFEYEYLAAKLTEVHEAIEETGPSFDADHRRRLAELEGRLRAALAGYELAGQTRSVSRL
jgi:hypothetical protein